VTPAGIAELKKLFPFTDYTEFEKDPSVAALPDAFTVNSLVGYLGGTYNGRGYSSIKVWIPSKL